MNKILSSIINLSSLALLLTNTVLLQPAFAETAKSQASTDTSSNIATEQPDKVVVPANSNDKATPASTTEKAPSSVPKISDDLKDASKVAPTSAEPKKMEPTPANEITTATDTGATTGSAAASATSTESDIATSTETVVDTNAVKIPPKKVRYGQVRQGMQYAGWLEMVCLQPSRQVFKAKLDSGAKTTSLHATNIVDRTQNGERWVDFELVDDNGNKQQYSKAVVREVVIKEHFGQKQSRPVVMMTIQLGEALVSAEVNLVDRSGLNYDLLLGRKFLQDQIVIDPGIIFNLKTNCLIE